MMGGNSWDEPFYVDGIDRNEKRESQKVTRVGVVLEVDGEYCGECVFFRAKPMRGFVCQMVGELLDYLIVPGGAEKFKRHHKCLAMEKL